MLIDANIFLEVLLEQQLSKKCKEILEKIQTGENKAFVSTFTIDAIALLMNRYKIPSEKIILFLNSLFNYKGLVIYNVTMKDRIDSVYFMDKYKLDYEDAITLGAALSCKCGGILSLDKHFDKIKEIKRVEP